MLYTNLTRIDYDVNYTGFTLLLSAPLRHVTRMKGFPKLNYFRVKLKYFELPQRSVIHHVIKVECVINASQKSIKSFAIFPAEPVAML